MVETFNKDEENYGAVLNTKSFKYWQEEPSLRVQREPNPMLYTLMRTIPSCFYFISLS